MSRRGITDDYLTGKLKEGLNATETKFFQKDGVVKDERTMADFHARAKYQEMTHRLKGQFPKDENVAQAALIIRIPDKPESVEQWNAAAELEAGPSPKRLASGGEEALPPGEPRIGLTGQGNGEAERPRRKL